MAAMKKWLFGRLVESMSQHNEIARSERAPAREFHIDAVAVKEIRALTQLSQSKFARILDVDVGTLRNWEQGRREPTGPAKALLRAIKNDPKAVPSSEIVSRVLRALLAHLLDDLQCSYRWLFASTSWKVSGCLPSKWTKLCRNVSQIGRRR
jgi:putative transcriptional regulator